MKKIVIVTLFVCLVPLASADVNVTLTVDWNLFVSPLYTGIVCIENTNLFGAFDTIIVEYSYNDHSGGVPLPKDLFLQDKGGNIYCANLEPTYWDSTSDTLDNAKITVKNSGYVIFQDDKWSTDVPVIINDSNHLFLLMLIVCIDNDDDSYNVASATCPMGNDCNDSNSTIHPAAIEVCDRIDNDCNGNIDEGRNTAADLDCDSCIDNNEFTAYANKWINIKISNEDFVIAANKWVTLDGCPK